MDANEINGHWHLRKEVTLGTLLALIGMFSAMVAGYVDIKSDLQSFNEHVNLPAHADAERRLDRLEAGQSAIIASIEGMAVRLDEIIRRLERIEDRLNANGQTL